jgi:glycosyltransferase involved in cell wall biosynthesis
LPAETYDGAFVGEFLEHVGNYRDMIDAIEHVLAPGSRVVFTVPYGPLGEIVPRTMPLKRGHVHHFTQRDLNAVFGQKADLEIRFLAWPGVTPRGAATGNWLIGYRTSDAPTGDRPYRDRLVTTRPYARVSVGIIAGNAEFEIGKCVESVWGLADEIVIGLCGTTDGTRQVAEAFQAPSGQTKIRFLELPHVGQHEDGFAGVRNEVLRACRGEWFLWIDTDEVLLRGAALGQYLESGPYLGYSIHQNHLQIDAPNHYDRPVRLFKRIPAIQFYGCVHEQPQLHDANGDIDPGLEVFDAQIAHTGYLLVEGRRAKMLERNLPLLERDLTRFPTRRLGKVLVLRDYANLGDIACEETHGGQVTDKAAWYYHQARVLFQREFADPADKYHELARPFYERALQQLQMGMEVETSLAGKRGGLNGTRAKPHRFWVQTAEEMEHLIAFKVAKAAKTLRPAPLRVDPFDDETAEEAHGTALRPVEDSAPVA